LKPFDLYKNPNEFLNFVSNIQTKLMCLKSFNLNYPKQLEKFLIELTFIDILNNSVNLLTAE
jgi:hypothetical protein